MARKKNKTELKELIDRVVKSVSSEFTVDEVLLYGSYAKDTAHEWSDVDIAVISPDLKNNSIFRNVREIKEKIKLYEPDLQLIAFPTKVFNEETFIEPNFIKEIKQTGKRVYSKEYGLDYSAL